jgi:hypothetical protein
MDLNKSLQNYYFMIQTDDFKHKTLPEIKAWLKISKNDFITSV